MIIMREKLSLLSSIQIMNRNNIWFDYPGIMYAVKEADLSTWNCVIGVIKYVAFFTGEL